MDAVWRLTLLAQALAVLMGAWPSLGQTKCSFKYLNDLKISPITSMLGANNKLYLLDRSDLENTRLFVNGQSVHAVVYDIATNTITPKLTVTNTWCSAGAFLPDGTIVNTGGNDAGVKQIRVLKPCGLGVTTPVPGLCDEWFEDPKQLVLNESRWYPASAILPNGDIFVLGGSDDGGGPTIPNWEIVSPFKTLVGTTTYMQFLLDAEPNNLYPFLHLLPTGNFFIFANTKGLIYNYLTNTIVKEVPEIPDKRSRQYVSTGSSVMLPLSFADGFQKSEVLICGGSVIYPSERTTATRSCYRIDVSESALNTLAWQGLELMKGPRLMCDMLYLLDGTILIINGMQRGYAGFGTSQSPVKGPEIYNPSALPGKRFTTLGCSSKYTRSYHSEATLIPDGRVLLTGGNLDGGFDISGKKTNYLIEEFRPPYLLSTLPRPTNLTLVSTQVTYGQPFTVTFSYVRPPKPPKGFVNASITTVAGAMIAPAVTTHSISYNLRYLRLQLQTFDASGSQFTATFVTPPNNVICPPGYYLFSLTQNKLPATAIWVRIA